MLPFPSDTEALLFDCDGTLADTMTLHYAAWRETMAAHGVDLPREFIDKHAGVPTDLIVEDINNCWGVTLDPPAISEEKEDRFRLHIELVEPIEEVVATAQSYFGKLPMAVVSGGPVDVVTATLEQISVLDLFPVLVTASDPVPPKPSPEVFLEAARRLGVDPTKCHVFEDGDPGIVAAKAAGMTYTDVRLVVAARDQ
ncbi:HAD family hydrolase [Aeoliella mucimassa]|uniref:Fructose-1-phosphate phosphatase YqaB n=1 Tax=Aeoliella mucimassa TaxID=2527972 RepID=A0A518ATE2_9BACT|nr:HAD family phosphatase [Aeoliella mucimassa]QDU57976.1 Fructose-1-phosphate phosphatase YqaB [Aeoliella mucimassa]